MEKEIKNMKINYKYRANLLKTQTPKPSNTINFSSQDLNIDVKQCIKKICTKMQNAKIQSLHPPYFQKSLTKFRNQYFNQILKNKISQKLNNKNQNDLKKGLQLLNSFVLNFDEEYIDVYIEQIREPYIRKIFNQSYEIDKINFKKLNSQYQLRKQIEEVITQTSEWLIQIQLLQDILDRIQLYFSIKSQSIMEKLKTEGAEDRKGTWTNYFSSLVRRTTSFALRKGSRVVQNTGYATILTPGFAILTWALIGGSASLPFQGGIDGKTLLIPILAFTVPYLLDSMAESIQRNDFQKLLQSWSQQFEIINKSIRSFNELLLNQLKLCCKSNNEQQYKIHIINLQKYVQNLSKKVDKISNYDQKAFQQMRQRTTAYFTQYIQIEDGQWITVMTPELYQKMKKTKNQK